MTSPTVPDPRYHIRAVKLGLQAQNEVADLKIRAERKAGQLLPETLQRGGDPTLRGVRLAEKGRQQGQRDETFDNQTFAPPKLADIGLSRFQSHRWQTEASVPDDARRLAFPAGGKC